jgi:glyoxylase-like metal-dependent hydrolase (beta-lactamase superfamily II)
MSELCYYLNVSLIKELIIMWKKVLLWVAGILGALALLIAVTIGPTLRDFLTIEIIEESPGIYYLMDYGGNSGLIIGDSIAVIVDTKMANGTDKLKAFAKEKIGDRELIVINTHFHPDHVLGNEKFQGFPIYAGDYGRDLWLTQNEAETMPTNWVKENMTIDLGGGENVQLIAVGQNHTQKDLFVYSPKHKVLFAGDIYTHLSHPVMKEGSDPDIVKWEATLRKYAAGPLEIERVIPGHGDLAEKEDLLLMANYFSDIKILPKKELKKKYKKWESLPFLAGLNKSLNFVKEEADKS